MKFFRCAFVVFATALASPNVWSADDGWRLDKDKDGIQVYTRAVEGWSIREFKGVTRIPARLSSIVAVIDDVPATHELTEAVSTSEVRNRESSTRYQLYSTMKMPWPLTDRDVLNQREITQDKNTHAVTIVDVAIPDAAAPRKNFVHIVKSHQQWTLTPTADGQVQVEMQTLSDPGQIPAAIINASLVSTPFKTLSRLKELVQRPKYANADLPFIEEAAGNK